MPRLQSRSDLNALQDLVPTLFGLGIFIANATIRSSVDSTALDSMFRISRLGVLNAAAHGYLMAIMSWVRQEQNPSWVTLLRPDAQEVYKQTIPFAECKCITAASPIFSDR